MIFVLLPLACCFDTNGLARAVRHIHSNLQPTSNNKLTSNSCRAQQVNLHGCRRARMRLSCQNAKPSALLSQERQANEANESRRQRRSSANTNIKATRTSAFGRAIANATFLTLPEKTTASCRERESEVKPSQQQAAFAPLASSRFLCACASSLRQLTNSKQQANKLWRNARAHKQQKQVSQSSARWQKRTTISRRR